MKSKQVTMPRGCTSCGGGGSYLPSYVIVQAPAPAQSSGAGIVALLAPLLTIVTSLFSGTGMQIHSGNGNTIYYALVLLILYFAVRRENSSLSQVLASIA